MGAGFAYDVAERARRTGLFQARGCPGARRTLLNPEFDRLQSAPARFVGRPRVRYDDRAYRGRRRGSQHAGIGRGGVRRCAAGVIGARRTRPSRCERSVPRRVDGLGREIVAAAPARCGIRKLARRTRRPQTRIRPGFVVEARPEPHFAQARPAGRRHPIVLHRDRTRLHERRRSGPPRYRQVGIGVDLRGQVIASQQPPLREGVVLWRSAPFLVYGLRISGAVDEIILRRDSDILRRIFWHREKLVIRCRQPHYIAGNNDVLMSASALILWTEVGPNNKHGRGRLWLSICEPKLIVHNLDIVVRPLIPSVEMPYMDFFCCLIVIGNERILTNNTVFPCGDVKKTLGIGH